MSDQDLTRFNANIPSELHRRFKAQSAASGLVMGDVVEKLIGLWVDIYSNTNEALPGLDQSTNYETLFKLGFDVCARCPDKSQASRDEEWDRFVAVFNVIRHGARD